MINNTTKDESWAHAELDGYRDVIKKGAQDDIYVIYGASDDEMQKLMYGSARVLKSGRVTLELYHISPEMVRHIIDELIGAVEI